MDDARSDVDSAPLPLTKKIRKRPPHRVTMCSRFQRLFGTAGCVTLMARHHTHWNMVLGAPLGCAGTCSCVPHPSEKCPPQSSSSLCPPMLHKITPVSILEYFTSGVHLWT